MRKINCLDLGFVELVEWMPHSEDPKVVESIIVKAARTSTTQDYGKQVKTEKEDKALIRYLYRNKHTSPFEMVSFTFCIKAPIFVIRQLVRHRTGKMNEFSGRYSEFPDEYYDPLKVDKGIRYQDMSLFGNKQGSSTHQEEITVEIKEKFSQMNQYIDNIFELYHSLLKDGVSKEIARYALPVATYSQLYFCMDLHNLLHFLELRLDSHAQPEIRVYARAMYDLIKNLVPTVIECFDVFTLNAVSLSAIEIKATKELNLALVSNARERKEFLDKLELLGLNTEKEIPM